MCQTRMEGVFDKETDKGLAMDFTKALQAVVDEAVSFTVTGPDTEMVIGRLAVQQTLIAQRVARIAQEVAKAEVAKHERALEFIKKATRQQEEENRKLRTDAHYLLKAARRFMLRDIIDLLREDGPGPELIERWEEYKLKDSLVEDDD